MDSNIFTICRDSRKEFNDFLFNGTNSISDIITRANTINDDIQKSITDLFSSSKGYGEDIKKYYAKVNDFSAPNFSKINTIDIGKVLSTYYEYLSGMQMYVDNELRSIQETSQDEVLGKIKFFEEKDTVFRESLFTGNNKDMTVLEGLNSLENFITFKNDIDGTQKYFAELKDIIGNMSLLDDPIAVELVKFLTKSFISFSVEAICKFETIIVDINNSVNGKSEVALAVSKILHPEVEKPKLQLF